MPVVIEIVAKLGDTILEHAFVPPGSTYRFAGLKLAAKPGQQRAGMVEITMERTFHVENPLARPPIAVRPWFFVLGSLALHVTIWAIAMTRAPFERLTAKYEPHYRYIHVEAPLPEPPPPPPKQAKVAAKAMPAASGALAATTHARRGVSDNRSMNEMLHEDAAAILARVAASTPDTEKAMQGVGPLYNEDDANQRGFGGGGHFDPDASHALDSVPTGDYDTSGIAEAAMLYGLSPDKKARLRIEQQTRLAHKSAIRGDCVPSHRIAKWLKKVDADLYKQIYLGDPDIVYCLAQPVPPSFVSQDERKTR